MTKHYVIHVVGGTDPEVRGPYKDSRNRDLTARRGRRACDEEDGVFWLDIWRWDTKWVLFKGDTIWDVPKEALDEIAASPLSKPFTMTLPPGLIVLLLAGIGFGIFAYVTRNDDDYDPAEGQQDPLQGQDPGQQPPAEV